MQGKATFQSEVLSLSLQGIAMDQNKLEVAEAISAKSINTDSTKDRASTERRVSGHLVFLADLVLSEAVAVARECMLTAFSLEPSPSIFQKLKLFAAVGERPVEHVLEEIEAVKREPTGARRLEVKDEAFVEACSILCKDLQDVIDKKNKGGGYFGTKLAGGLIAIQVRTTTTYVVLHVLQYIKLFLNVMKGTSLFTILFQGDLLTAQDGYDAMACPLFPAERERDKSGARVGRRR